MDAIHWIPTWTDVAQFLDSFWPNVVATAIGVALGLPAAHWLERRRREADRSSEERQSREAIALLVSSLLRNADGLLHVRSTVTARASVVFPGVDVASWEIVRQQVLAMLDIPIRDRLARFFEGLERVRFATKLHIEGTVGVAGALPGSDVMLGQISAQLRDWAGILATEALDLVEEIGGYSTQYITGDQRTEYADLRTRLPA